MCEFTVVTTPFGLPQYNSMDFYLILSSTTCQRAIYLVNYNIIGVPAYGIDIAVFRITKELQVEILGLIFKQLRDYDYRFFMKHNPCIAKSFNKGFSARVMQGTVNKAKHTNRIVRSECSKSKSWMNQSENVAKQIYLYSEKIAFNSDK